MLRVMVCDSRIQGLGVGQYDLTVSMMTPGLTWVWTSGLAVEYLGVEGVGLRVQVSGFGVSVFGFFYFEFWVRLQKLTPCTAVD